MVQRIDVTGADGVRLAAWEFREPAGEPGTAPEVPTERERPGVLLLHGLMGRALHWAGTARWLAEHHRVIALDQRGHGQSAGPAADPGNPTPSGARPSWPTPRPSSSASASPP